MRNFAVNKMDIKGKKKTCNRMKIRSFKSVPEI